MELQKPIPLAKEWLHDYLDCHPAMPSLETITPKQADVTRTYKLLVDDRMQSDASIKCAVIDNTRDPSKKFGAFINFED